MSNEYFEGVKERFKLYFPLVLKSTGIGFVILLIIGLFPWEYQVKTKDGGKISIKKENVSCKKKAWPRYRPYTTKLGFDTGKPNKSRKLYKKYLKANNPEQYNKEFPGKLPKSMNPYNKSTPKEKNKISFAYECAVYGTKESLIGNESIYKSSEYCFGGRRNSIPCEAASYHDIIKSSEMILYKLK